MRLETIMRILRRRAPSGPMAGNRAPERPAGDPLPLPSFLCVGAQKAGTTTLQELLSRHPRVYLPREKELQYFTLHSDRAPEWYAGAFARARPGQLRGDITPYYLFHPAAPARIRSLLPDARLVVLLRDPVERALSGYFHSVRLNEEPLPIEEAFAVEERRLEGADEVLLRPGARHHSHQMHSYVARSRYEIQIRRYLLHFDAARLLLVRSEDLFRDPAAVWERLTRFLDLDGCPLPGPMPHANRGRSEAGRVEPSFRRKLRERLDPTYNAMEADHGIRW